MSTHIIHTDYHRTPLLVRHLDWTATFDDYDGAPDSNCPVGHGATEAEAIADLFLEQENLSPAPEELDPDRLREDRNARQRLLREAEGS